MMIIFLGVWLLGWSLAMLLRLLAAPTITPTMPLARPKQRHAGPSWPLGLEDDPRQWPPPPVRGDWTELDERQLIRLLTDAASMTQPAGDPPPPSSASRPDQHRRGYQPGPVEAPEGTSRPTA